MRYIFSTLITLGLFALIPVTSIASYAPALSGLHTESVLLLEPIVTPVVDFVKSFLDGTA